jgi:hypothetical protein
MFTRRTSFEKLSVMNRLKAWLVANSKIAHVVGQATFAVGGFLIVAGLIGRAGLAAINATRKLAQQPPIRLSEAYPAYPLWWVPEGVAGFAIGLILAGSGIYLALSAKTVLKQRRRF